MLALPAPPRRRRPGLTPMIDVVFLLLVFFMLAARFGTETALPLRVASGAGDWQGPPRLVEVWPGEVRVNGVVTVDPAEALVPLMAAPSDTVVVMPRGGATVADLTALLETLRAAGLSRIALAEGQP